MKDSWVNHNTDKMLLFVLVIIMWGSSIAVAIHIFHHDLGQDMQAIAFISFMTGSFSTVLGALILILTGRLQRADNQTANGLPPTAAALISPPSPSSPAPIQSPTPNTLPIPAASSASQTSVSPLPASTPIGSTRP